MRLVLDTNVVASALFWNGTPRWLLQIARDKRIELFTSTALLAELTNVLWREKFDQKIAAATFTIDQLVDRYAELAVLVRPATGPRITPDPDDDVVIGTALAAKADCIVTGDRTFLAVGEYQGVRITRVAVAAQLINAG